MKKKLAYLFVSILLFSYSLFGQNSTNNSQQKSSFEDKVVKFVNDTKVEEIIISIQKHTPILELMINGTIKSGKLDVVLVDPYGNNFGKFAIEAEALKEKGTSLGEMNKFFKEPTSGDWKIKISTVNVTGKIKIEADFEKDYFVNASSEFSPNGDGINDTLKLEYYNISEIISFKIFDRWGKTVFLSTKMDDVWDGKVDDKHQDAGTYFYLIKAKTNTGQEITQSGYTVLEMNK